MTSKSMMRRVEVQLANEPREKLLEIIASLQFTLGNACCVEHYWRPAPGGDYTTPHQVCQQCRKARPTPMPTGPGDLNG